MTILDPGGADNGTLVLPPPASAALRSAQPTFAARCFANVPAALKLCHVGYVMLEYLERGSRA
jgi:hypothetical protein